MKISVSVLKKLNIVKLFVHASKIPWLKLNENKYLRDKLQKMMMDVFSQAFLYPFVIKVFIDGRMQNISMSDQHIRSIPLLQLTILESQLMSKREKLEAPGVNRSEADLKAAEVLYAYRLNEKMIMDSERDMKKVNKAYHDMGSLVCGRKLGSVARKLPRRITVIVVASKEKGSKATHFQCGHNTHLKLELSKLVDEIYEKVKEKESGVSVTSVKSFVLLIGQRSFYGLMNVNADVLEDGSEACLCNDGVIIKGYKSKNNVKGDVEVDGTGGKKGVVNKGFERNDCLKNQFEGNQSAPVKFGRNRSQEKYEILVDGDAEDIPKKKQKRGIRLDPNDLSSKRMDDSAPIATVYPHQWLK
ncbi:hypothetical protein AgCh_002348 [Apium graveolens]